MPPSSADSFPRPNDATNRVCAQVLGDADLRAIAADDQAAHGEADNLLVELPVLAEEPGVAAGVARALTAAASYSEITPSTAPRILDMVRTACRDAGVIVSLYDETTQVPRPCTTGTTMRIATMTHRRPEAEPNGTTPGQEPTAPWGCGGVAPPQ